MKAMNNNDKRRTQGVLDAEAIMTHEMYSAYIRAGFNEEQAMHLVVALMTAKMMKESD